MRFTISGRDYNITAEDIAAVAEGQPPQKPDGRCKYYVLLNDKRYLIKQLLAGATGLDRIEFTAQYAHRILSRLGFNIQEFDHPPYKRPSLPPDTRLTNRTEDPEILVGPASGSGVRTNRFAVTLEPDEDGFIVASCPELPGCHSQGRTRDEAINNIKEAIRGYVASMKAHGEEIPNFNWELVEVAA